MQVNVKTGEGGGGEWVVVPLPHKYILIGNFKLIAPIIFSISHYLV